MGILVLQSGEGDCTNILCEPSSTRQITAEFSRGGVDPLPPLDSCMLNVYSQFEQRVIVAFKCQFQNSIIFNDIHVYLILKLVNLVYTILPCLFGSWVTCWNSETIRGSLMRPNRPKLASLAQKINLQTTLSGLWCILCFKNLPECLDLHRN